MKARRTTTWMLIAVLAMALLLSGCGQSAEVEKEDVYTVYFGLNDGDTGEQKVAMEDASAYIRGVIEDHGFGYTEYRTYGAYTEDGKVKGNDSLIYMLTFIEKDQVEAIADEVIEHLNLDSVFCQKTEKESMYFVGEGAQ